MGTDQSSLKLEDVFAVVIDLAKQQADAGVDRTRATYREKYGEVRGSGIYSPWDWARISYVRRLVQPGGRVLDVGVGSGQFINTLAESGEFDSVVGVDIMAHSKFVRLNDKFDMKYCSVADLQFDTGAFDTVTCMEVLEHVDRRTFEAGLAELRRVCRGTLVMSVPFEEPEPLPSYHKLRFDRADLVRIWPRAKRVLLKRPGVGWALMIEDVSVENAQ